MLVLVVASETFHRNTGPSNPTSLAKTMHPRRVVLIHRPDLTSFPSLTRRSCITMLTALLLVMSGISPAAAQSAGNETTAQGIIDFLVRNRAVGTDDFDKDLQAAQATSDTLTRALLASVATTPLGSSSGGFNYRLNPALGTVERASDTFGPFYLERALTSGAGQASFGFTYQYATFRSLDGNNLRDGTFVTVANQFSDEPAPFDVERLQLRITSRTATLFGNVGIGDRVDVGAAVPMVRLTINGSRVNEYRGESLLQARASATTTGFADIALRTKVRLTPTGSPGAVAAGVEARLPTGREEDLLGTGDLALRFLGIASYEASRTGVYGNFILGTGGLGREVGYGGGVTFAAATRVTLVGEVLLRRIEGIQGITAEVAPHPRIVGVSTARLVPGGEDVTTGFSVIGVKWNVGDRWLVHSHVLVPVSNNGLTARFTPTLAIDYSFGR